MAYDGEGDCPLEMIIEIDEGEVEDRNFCHDDKKEEVHMVQHIDPATSTLEYEQSDIPYSNNVKPDESYSITPDTTVKLTTSPLTSRPTAVFPNVKLGPSPLTSRPTSVFPNVIKTQIISPAPAPIDQDFEKKFKEFPEIEMNIKTAENKLLQIMYQLLYNVKAKDEPSVLIDKILDFSRVNFPTHGEGYVQRELFLLLRTRDELVHITRLLGIPSKTENRKMIDDIMAFLTKTKKTSNQGKAVTCVQMKPPEAPKEKPKPVVEEKTQQDIQHMQKIGRARKSCSWPTQKKDPDFITPTHQPIQSPVPSVASRTRSNQHKSTLDLLKDPPPPPAKKSKYYASDPDSGDDNVDDPLEHPSDEELQRQIHKIMSETNLEPIWMNMVEKVLQNYPKFDLQYRREFVKTTVKQLVGKKLLSQSV